MAETAFSLFRLNEIARGLTRGHLRVLAYHRVENAPLLEDHLRYVAANYNAISEDRLLLSLREGEHLPERAVLITFDDGDGSLVRDGAPLLRTLGIPAVTYVIAGMLGSEDLPWWLEVRRTYERVGPPEGHPPTWRALVRRWKWLPTLMRDARMAELRRRAGYPSLPGDNLTPRDLRTLVECGVAIGNHTWSHPCLTTCDRKTVEWEVRRAHEVLEGALGRPARTFAYPIGDYDARAEGVLRELGYEAAFLFDHRLQRVPPARSLAISRLRVSSTTPLQRFRLIVDGPHPMVHRVLGRS